MTTKEKMQILLDGGKLASFGRTDFNFISFKDDKLVDEHGFEISLEYIKVSKQIYTEPEDNQLYEWAIKHRYDSEMIYNEAVMTKKMAKELFKQCSEYYLLRKFEPLETFKNEN